MEPQRIELTVSDLDEMRQVLDLACARGAFRGSEMTRVGQVYDRLEIFISAIVESASRPKPQGETND